jgi:hypothetical protein
MFTFISWTSLNTIFFIWQQMPFTKTLTYVCEHKSLFTLQSWTQILFTWQQIRFTIHCWYVITKICSRYYHKHKNIFILQTWTQISFIYSEVHLWTQQYVHITIVNKHFIHLTTFTIHCCYVNTKMCSHYNREQKNVFILHMWTHLTTKTVHKHSEVHLWTQKVPRVTVKWNYLIRQHTFLFCSKTWSFFGCCYETDLIASQNYPLLSTTTAYHKSFLIFGHKSSHKIIQQSLCH